MYQKGTIVKIVGWGKTQLLFGICEPQKIEAEYSCYGTIEGSVPGGYEIRSLRTGESYVWVNVDVARAFISSELSKIKQREINLRIAEKTKKEKTKLEPNQTYFYAIDFSKPIPSGCRDYVYGYIGNFVEDRFFKEENVIIRDACDLFSPYKSSRDILILLPESILSFLGYTSQSIINWVSFIKKLGFDLEFSGSVKEDDTLFQETEVQVDNCYIIKIPASECPKRQYIPYLLIRYLMFEKLNNIPGLVLQLKNATNLTYWQSLLIAHAYANTDDYYGLKKITIINNSVIIPDPFSKIEKFIYEIERSGLVSKNIPTITITVHYYNELLSIIQQRRFGDIEAWMAGLRNNISEEKINIDETPWGEEPKLKKFKKVEPEVLLANVLPKVAQVNQPHHVFQEEFPL